MSESKNININPDQDKKIEVSDPNIAALSEVSSVAGSVKQNKHATSSERQMKFKRAQKCLENAALVSKRIKEHRKATAELLGRPFEDDIGDTASEIATTISERTGYSVATDTSTTLSVQDALNIPGISESLANTLKQKELLMERIKQYKEISKRPMKKTVQTPKKESISETIDLKKGSENIDITKLMNTIKEKENNLSVMQVKMRAMETTILDLQEKNNEKDQIIEAKNRATTLMSDSLSKKEKDTLDLLEDTKEQMIKMQTNFITMETEWKQEKQKLIYEIEEKNDKIRSLEEANTILENSRFEITIAHSKLAEELDLKTKEVMELQEKISQLSDNSTQLTIEEKPVEEEKGSIEICNMEELSKKIELLEQINFEIRQTNKELENQLTAMNQETKPSVSPNKRGSPLPARKTGRGSKMKSPWSHLSSESLQETGKGKSEKPKPDMMLQSLNKEILQKEYMLAQKDTLIMELQSTIDKKEATISELELLLKTSKQIVETSDMAIAVDLQTSLKDTDSTRDTATKISVEELEEKLKLAQDQIVALNEEIEASNKNMIKVKSNFKIKLKQMQKTIENFSKVSDANAEIVKLNEELHQLTQKVAELEEEKGNLQLHLVDYDGGRLTESEVYKKLVEMENLSETRLKSITLLETQKFDLVQELHSLQQKNLEMEDKLADISSLQNEQVCSEMKSVQLEEQIDKLQASKQELELIIDNLKLDREQLNGTIKILQEEKEELLQKLDNYIQENIELTDKLEKLSAEKVSSAESIEIVESLTTQEKLELEEYNKSLQTEKKTEDSHPDYSNQSEKHEIQKEKLIEEAIELKKKIDLFSCERQEVMEKMNKLSLENESLNENLQELTDQCNNLKTTIEQLNLEKAKLISLNDDLNHQIEELKHERSEILKETADAIKPSNTEDTTDGMMTESVHHDDKSAGDKGTSRTKSVKQLTKEILKLKNTIKEREDEIADCQMKILSLEEQQDKQKESLVSNASNEKLIKKLTDENDQLRKEIDTITNENKAGHDLHINQAELLQAEIQKVHQEYTSAINARDTRIHELENILLEYEKQVINYSNTLQQKDKELSEYINQITKLNDVSQKLKSTVDLLEEEKAKDQNNELIKSLNKQIAFYQSTLSDYEEKFRAVEEEKAQLMTVKSKLENKNSSLEAELKKLHETFAEKQDVIKELQSQQQKQQEELSSVVLQAKERDEEIHEIKLQLRKESIDNEKLHNIVVQKSSEFNELTKLYEDAKEKLSSISVDKNFQNEQYTAMENKNKELMEKLKKFALNIKKKTAMYTELENQYHEIQKQLEYKNEQYDQLLIQVETIPALQEKLKHAEEEFNRLQSQKLIIEQKSQEILHLQSEIETLHSQITINADTIKKLNESMDSLNKDVYFARDENVTLKNQIETLNKKIVEYEIEQKNNANILTKISCLESDLNQKNDQIIELTNQIEIQNERLSQVQFGHDAKVQERDMYIESLQSEIDKYKNRIYRLQESISAMENSRRSLEQKTDDLDTQLHEKQKAYNEYTDQEDELVNRLAVLIDIDRVAEKQLHEIESENKELRFKVQNLNEEIQKIQKSCFDLQNKCNLLEDKAKKADTAESEIITYQNNIRDLEADLKRVTHDHSTLVAQKKKDIEELELEFNMQIENDFKEKKILSEKYEKINEHVSQLELKLNEYRNTIESLNVNLSELVAENQMLVKNKTNNIQKETSDYTEQYISEINKLNAILNSKNQEILVLTDKIQKLQENNLSNMAQLDSKNSNLTEELQSTSQKINNLLEELDILKRQNEHLQTVINQKDEQIRQITENTKLVFEMNIPKTEGMTISSTIEAMNEEPKPFDISYLQSQIISDTKPATVEPLPHVAKTVPDAKMKQSPHVISSTGVIEETIVPKKSYICYTKEEEEKSELDPFNSDEGWGLGASEEPEEVIPGFANLNQQIQQLNDANQKLKSELDTTNAKLLKALKKLKELKVTNDMLSNELQLTKQISQSSMLDMAIESELSNNVEVLEKKIQELNADLSKEKREKEYLKKQNEVFKNANDRLTEMKEKMDNELQMWKYNFKQVNDKVSSLQWDGELKDTTDYTNTRPISTHTRVDNSEVQEEMIKLEKENDELQNTIDNMIVQNKELSVQLEQFKSELSNLKQQLQQRQESCDNCKNVNVQIQEITKQKEQLQMEINALKQQLEQKVCENCEVIKRQLHETLKRFSDLEESHKILNENKNQLETRHGELILEIENLQRNIQDNEFLYKTNENDLVQKNNELLQEIECLKIVESEANIKILSLNNELENIQLEMTKEKQKVQSEHDINAVALAEKCHSMEEHCLNLKNNLDDAHKKIYVLEEQNKQSSENITEYEKQIHDLNIKLQNLNTENDQLLSTVTELRSSVSSAMDQRGFEIAELWKQHLAQRESEFQQTEQDLRSQLNASEAKYEQLLEKVQSSNQEETNKIILAEQISSLQNKLQEKEEHLTSLKDKYAEVINQLDILRSEMEDEKIIHENKIFEHQEEYEKIIQELNKNNQEQCDQIESKMKNLQIELEATKSVNSTLSQEIEDLRNNYENKISDLVKQLQVKDSEIFQKTHDFTITLTQRNDEFENVRKQLIEYEKRIEDLTYEKESELAILRLKMHEHTDGFDKKLKEMEDEKNNLSESLKEKIIECTNLNKQISDLNKVLEEYANRATETQMVLESQELEIVTLKDEVSSLKDSLRAASSRIEKHVTFASGTKPGPDGGEYAPSGLDKELLDAVPRAELDLALYMLHQRDVRCEELTMELTQLLEERDTLQIRLSDSLRSFEDLKSRCNSAGLDTSIGSSKDGISELASFSIEKENQFVDTHKAHTSRSSSISDPDADKPKLQAKLSELRSVKHSRDVRLRNESEQRQLGMRLLHRDVANLPPEAVEQLTQAHHTLSRDTQSTPTVLLNWLRGKSTPKVVHM
ncbi:unnamed protein product, partial [Brenthis ino]